MLLLTNRGVGGVAIVPGSVVGGASMVAKEKKKKKTGGGRRRRSTSSSTSTTTTSFITAAASPPSTAPLKGKNKVCDDDEIRTRALTDQSLNLAENHLR